MSRTLVIAGLVICALSLGACDKKTETKAAFVPAATVPVVGEETAAPVLVERSGFNDMYEIKAGRIAMERASDPRVKTFAEDMVGTHTASDADLVTAIGDAGLSLMAPMSLNAELQGRLRDLENASGTDFDRLYIDGEIEVNQAGLKLLQRYAEGGDVPALKAFAAKTAPTVQKHLETARTLKDSMKYSMK